MALIDTRGHSCPEPVLMVKNELSSGEAHYEVLVDNHTAIENIKRFAAHNGYTVTVANHEEDYMLKLDKK